MSGLDDLLGSLTKSKGGGAQAGSLGLDDLLGGLLGGGAARGGGGSGGLEDLLGGLLGGGATRPRAGGGLDLTTLVAVLGPLLARVLKGGGLSKLVQGAQANGLAAEADTWIGTGQNLSLDAEQARAVVGAGTVRELAQEAGVSEDEAAEVLASVVPQVVNGLTPAGQLPSDDEVDDFLARFAGATA